jgi:hypothetical protein
VPVALDGATVALSAIDVPANCGPTGLGAFRAVVVAIGSISYEVGELEDALKPAPTVGVKAAVMESVPTGRAVVVMEADPLTTVTGVPRADPPTSNWTVPVAPDGVTVAFSVTDVP